MATTTAKTERSITGKKDLTVTIEPRSKQARSLLPDVIDQLESLTRFLKSLSDGDTTFEVISLSKQSPMTAVLRGLRRTKVAAKKRVEGRAYTYRSNGTTTDRAAKALTALASHKKLPSYVDPYALTHLRDFADDLGKTDHTATVTANGETFKVDERLKEQIDSSLGNIRIAYTSYTGELGRLNAHGSKWSFTIFPPAGPTRILCYFDSKEIEAIRSLVTEVVTVRGRAVYRGETAWPVHIRVDTVESRKSAPEGFWAELPSKLKDHWHDASDADKFIACMGAEVA